MFANKIINDKWCRTEPTARRQLHPPKPLSTLNSGRTGPVFEDITTR